MASRESDNILKFGRMGWLRRLLIDQRFLFLLVGGINTAFSTVMFAVLVLTFAAAFLPAWAIYLRSVGRDRIYANLHDGERNDVLLQSVAIVAIDKP